jgi:hypothetical protein
MGASQQGQTPLSTKADEVTATKAVTGRQSAKTQQIEKTWCLL